MITDKLNDIQDVTAKEQAQEDINATYEFADGYIDPDDSLDEFLEDFQKPKEETGIEETPDEDLEVNLDEDPISSEQAKYTAQFIVDMTDEAIARGLSMYSLNPVDEHRAGKEQKKHLKDLWTKYCKEKAVEIPIGWQIAVAMITIYGAQLPKARQDRKLNERRKQLEEDERRLHYDRKLLEDERERLRLRQAEIKTEHGTEGDKTN